jgi:hypothetical protein
LAFAADCPGGFSKAREQRAQDHTLAVRERQAAFCERDRLQREVVIRREQSARSDRERSKRGLAIKDYAAR